MDRYSDEELEESGYFCKDCGGHPCNCEFIQAYEKYGDIICDDRAKILINDLYSLKEENNRLKEQLKELEQYINDNPNNEIDLLERYNNTKISGYSEITKLQQQLKDKDEKINDVKDYCKESLKEILNMINGD